MVRWQVAHAVGVHLGQHGEGGQVRRRSQQGGGVVGVAVRLGGGGRGGEGEGELAQVAEAGAPLDGAAPQRTGRSPTVVGRQVGGEQGARAGEGTAPPRVVDGGGPPLGEVELPAGLVHPAVADVDRHRHQARPDLGERVVRGPRVGDGLLGEGGGRGGVAAAVDEGGLEAAQLPFEGRHRDGGGRRSPAPGVLEGRRRRRPGRWRPG